MSNEIKQSALDRYKNTYSYHSLMEKHSLSEQGIWEVLGEDPNCDFGGHHYQPKLGTFEGKLEDIVAYAVNLSGFWQWGAGGNITKVGAPVKIDAESNARRKAVQGKIARLEEELKQARKELEIL